MSHNVEHFEVISITLPYVSGTCTVPEGVTWSQGYHTPPTCKEVGNAEWTYYFGTPNVPLSVNEFEAGHPICRQIKSISENTPVLQPNGIASRGSLNLQFNDFTGDPGPINTTLTGTYFSKFAARNFINGREVKIYRYRRENDVNTVVSTSIYVAESFSVSVDGIYTLSCKSRLERTYKDFTQFPKPTGAKLRADIDSAVTAIPVFDNDYDWSLLPKFRIGDEFLKSTSYDSPTQILTVATRGANITGTSGLITKTIAEEHDTGDDIQVCYVSDGEQIADFLELILLTAEMPASYIDKAAWQTEFDDFWSGSLITNIWSEPTAVKDILNQLCNDYMLDIWEESIEPAKIRVSAVSTWKQPSVKLEVGRGITESKFTFGGAPDLRASRAYIYYDKPFKSENEDRGNFKKLALNIDPTYEGSDFYGSVKEKELTPSPMLNTNDASLLTQRYTARYSIDPVNYSWDCEEKYLNYKTGDIVEFGNQDLQDAEGVGVLVRAQIMSVVPKYKYGGIGRAYGIKALTYISAVSQGGGIYTPPPITGTVSELNIHNYVGRPSGAVNIVIILDNCTILSDDVVNPSIRNGAFSTGSTVTIICINGTDWQAISGYGGNGAVWERNFEPGSPDWGQVPPTIGGNGGTCFNADGIATEIYLGGATGNPTYPTADGFIRAPGGGGGGSGGFSEGDAGDGGGSGAGNIPNVEGAAGWVQVGSTQTFGNAGQKGDTVGNGGESIDGGDGGDWGLSGFNGSGINGALGGLAGKGIVKSGATVIIYGSTPTNFINGTGDTPD